MVVAARSGAGVTLAIVATDQPGVTVNQLLTIARDKQCEVVLDNAAGELLGADGQGWALLQPVMQRYAVAECAYLVGLSQMDFEISVDYAKERVQFGRPIGSFQAIQHKCADMVTDVDGSRFIMYKAAWALNTDQDDKQMSVNMGEGLDLRGHPPRRRPRPADPRRHRLHQGLQDPALLPPPEARGARLGRLRPPPRARRRPARHLTASLAPRSARSGAALSGGPVLLRDGEGAASWSLPQIRFERARGETHGIQTG